MFSQNYNEQIYSVLKVDAHIYCSTMTPLLRAMFSLNLSERVEIVLLGNYYIYIHVTIEIIIEYQECYKFWSAFGTR